jgi:hypothetical protein
METGDTLYKTSPPPPRFAGVAAAIPYPEIERVPGPRQSLRRPATLGGWAHALQDTIAAASRARRDQPSPTIGGAIAALKDQP